MPAQQTPEEQKRLGQIAKDGRDARQQLDSGTLDDAGRAAARRRVLAGKRATDQLIEGNIPLSDWVAWNVPRLRRLGDKVGHDEVASACRAKLVEAAQTYDPSHGATFGQWARLQMRPVERELAAQLLGAASYTTSAYEFEVRAAAIRNRLESEGHTVTDELLRKELGPISDDMWHHVVGAISGPPPASLDAEVRQDGTASLNDTLADTRSEGWEAQVDAAVDAEASGTTLPEEVADALSDLPTEMRTVVELRTGMRDGRQWLFREIGAEMGVSREAARQWWYEAVQLMRDSNSQ